MGLAERRVNANVQDIAAEQKVQIAGLERSIRDYMRDPNYLAMKEAYKKDLGNYDNTPESVLATVKHHFDQMKTQESEFAGEQLRAISSMAISKLKEVKSDLGYTAEREEHYETRYAQTIGAMTGADKPIAEVPELPENMDMVEQILGERPRMKLEVRTEENSSLLAEIKKPENSVAYINASSLYADISGGYDLEEAGKVLSDAFTAGLEKIQKIADPAKKRAELIKLVDAQLKALTGVYKILSQSLFRYEAPETAVETDKNLLSPSDIALIFDTLLADSRWDQLSPPVLPAHMTSGKESTFTERLAQNLDAADQIFNVSTAYTYTTGRGSKDVNLVERSGLGVAQGLVSVPIGLARLTGGAVAWGGGVEKKVEASGTGLMDVLAKFSSNTELIENLKNVLLYGVKNTSLGEWTQLVSKIVTEVAMIFSGAKLSSGMVKGRVIASAVELGGSVALRTMVSAAELIATKVPQLSRYGYNAKTVVEGMGSAAHHVKEVWHHVHHAKDTYQLAKDRYKTTAGKLVDTTEAVAGTVDREKASSAYEEMDQLRSDFRAVLAVSEELGVTRDEKAKLSADKAALDSLAAEV